jgi:hypothetical protein
MSVTGVKGQSATEFVGDGSARSRVAARLAAKKQMTIGTVEVRPNADVFCTQFIAGHSLLWTLNAKLSRGHGL